MAEHKDTNDYLHTNVSGAINQHTPSYWRLALPALGARYFGRYFSQLYSGGAKLGGGLSKSEKAFDLLAGAWMIGVTTFFANRTRRDMMSIFSEAVAFEKNKDPQTMSFADLASSDNKAVRQSVSNFYRFNSLRYLVNGAFFTSFLPWKLTPGAKALDQVPSVDFGVGTNSAYLMYEVIARQRTFFEQVQNLVDTKLNQDKALGEDIKPIDLIRLYESNALDNDPSNAYKGSINSEMWHDSLVIFLHMADLMNDTYQHRDDDRKANFTLPKFIYLVGHNLIQPRNVEQSLALIEVADRYGMDDVKKVVEGIKRGKPLSEVMKPYPEAAETIKMLDKEYEPERYTRYVQTAQVKRNILSSKPSASFVDKTATNGSDSPTLSV